MIWQLEDWSQVPFELDKNKIEDFDYDPDDEISLLGYGRISVKSYMDYALKQFQLTVVNDHDRFLITTREAAESEFLRPKVYHLNTN